MNHILASDDRVCLGILPVIIIIPVKITQVCLNLHKPSAGLKKGEASEKTWPPLA